MAKTRLDAEVASKIELANLKSQFAELRNTHSQLHDEAKTLIDDIEALIQISFEKEDKITELKRAYRHLNRENVNLKKYISYADKQLNRAYGIKREDFPASSRSL